MVWGGEDWGSPADEGFLNHDDDDQYQKGFVTTSTSSNYSTSSTSGTNYYGDNHSTKTTEVKIKITKRQLEELLGKVDVKDMSVQQVLAQLISVSDGYQTQQLRSWRPALQSIPEVN